jgi:hypothetical protein
MPLIECSDCHKQISDEAYTCPNCGRPMKDRPGWTKPIILLGLALLCVFIPLFALAFLYVSRTLWHNLRTSLKGVGKDLLHRL